MNFLKQIIIALVFTAALCSARAGFAQPAFDGSGANGGGIIVGDNTTECTTALKGSIRYNSVTNRLQICTSTSTLTSGLTSYWKFDDGSGSGTAADSAGTNNGTLTNMNTSTAWVTGVFNGALEFDSADDYVSVPNAANLNFGTSSFSFSFWFYTKDITNSFGLFNKYGWDGGVGGNTGYGCSTHSFLVSVYCTIEDGTNGIAAYAANNSVTQNNTWYHVAFVVDRSSQLASIYVNGVLTDAPDDISAIGNIDSTSIDLWFGEFWGGDTLSGALDDVRFYDHALNAAEITDLYSNFGWTNWGN